MLAALELNGFKSFADRTRLEFPAGVTVVVGPNGSGKSNVVDAIKWVLGSQSVKSLRGKESTDVIFSGSKSRRQANAAEASLVFDNSQRILDRDDAEVQLTRRLYRSGETEYLINRQPCRLRDIRDLLSGVGMATSAYSIIEQGKVDAVLQATPKERRVIFEEAAGVSRFRTKREEALRRMDRVQQNLLRLADIVEELDGRLKSVRTQASKAERYKELADRLQQLRTLAGQADWQRLSRDMEVLATQVEAELAAVETLSAESRQFDESLAALDQAAEKTQDELRELAVAEAGLRERLTQGESNRGSHRARIDELEQEILRLSRQIEALTSRAGDAEQLVAETAEGLAESQTQLTGHQKSLAAKQAQQARIEEDLSKRRQQAAAIRTEMERAEVEARRLAEGDHKSQAERLALEAILARLASETEPLERERDRVAIEARQAARLHAERSEELDRAASELRNGQNKLADDRGELTAAHRQLADCDGRLTGARQRVEVLEELERRLEGLTAGAKEVLRRAQEDPTGPFSCVQGVVADLLSVDADSAPLVEIALGERANYLAVTDATELAPLLASEKTEWPGRTSFLRLDVPSPANAVDRIDLAAEAGVMGRADAFVDAEPRLAPMVRRLLGRHWFVDTLATALRLAGGAGRGLNFVTADGETVLADGTLTVGPRQTMAGLLSRRSELRALREQIVHLERERVAAGAASQRLERQIAQADAAVRELADRHNRLLTEHGDSRLAAASTADKLAQLENRLQAAETQRADAVGQVESLERETVDAVARAAELANAAETMRQRLATGEAENAALESQRSEVQAIVSDLRVQVARSEQRVEGLARQRSQLEHDHAERGRTLEETRLRAAECGSQKEQLAAAIIDAATAAQQINAQLVEFARQLRRVEAAREELRTERQSAGAQGERVRRSLFERQNRLQTARLELQRVQAARTTLAERLREDYQLDVAAIAPGAVVDDGAVTTLTLPSERGQIEEEIRSLKEQLVAAGPVNLEAVEELDSLEGRHRGLAQQYHDLQAAKARLEQIIAHINGESRQLFTDTIDAIRGHFQELFRRLFAGGEADIVVEADESGDVLECGISIVARPPGKQPRSISLLSGGERTMTCVALLLAIFRSRPSPFCVLDEVDAALDEANIDRFVDVLKQFMQSTQFIVITHSKRTMTCSDTLYGITMQESGVSKPVSVQFEDVSEDGHIRPEALQRDAASQSRAA